MQRITLSPSLAPAPGAIQIPQDHAARRRLLRQLRENHVCWFWNAFSSLQPSLLIVTITLSSGDWVYVALQLAFLGYTNVLTFLTSSCPHSRCGIFLCPPLDSPGPPDITWSPEAMMRAAWTSACRPSHPTQWVELPGAALSGYRFVFFLLKLALNQRPYGWLHHSHLPGPAARDSKAKAHRTAGVVATNKTGAPGMRKTRV